MDPATVGLFAAAIPAVVAALVCLAVRAARRGDDDPVPVACGVAAGYLAGHVGLSGAPHLLPVELWRWLPHLAVLGALVAIVESTAAASRWWFGGAFLRDVAALCAGWVLVLDRTIPWVGGVTLGVVALFRILHGPPDRPVSRSALASLLVVAVGTAVSLGVSGSAVVAQHCGAFAAACGACFVVGLRFPAAARGAVVPGALLLAGFVMNGVLLTDMPVATAVLLALAPFGAWLPDAFAGGPDRPVRALLLRAAAVALPVAVAVALAANASPPMDW